MAIRLASYFIVGFIIYLILNRFSLQVDIDNIIRSAFIDLIIFAMWEFAFNRWLWKTRFMRLILGIKTPYVYGRWKGYVRSSHDNFQTKFPIVIEIHQTHRSIAVTYYDERAISRSLVTEFVIEEGSLPKLFCVYRNEPIVADQKELQIHYGTMILTIPSERTKIKGVYFNHYLQRGTYGQLYVELESRKLKYCYE